MYNMPQLYGVQDYSQPCDALSVEICKEECTARKFPCDEDMYNLCEHYRMESNLFSPMNVTDAKHMYATLRRHIHNDL